MLLWPDVISWFNLYNCE